VLDAPQLVEQVRQAEPGMAQRHPRARVTHDLPGLLALSPLVGWSVDRLDAALKPIRRYYLGDAQAAAAAAAAVAAQGQRLVKEGTTLESAEDNLAELTAQAQTFADKQLVILRALMVG
jgi:hypothetical protein